jgi:hypothetical protein
MKTIVRRSLDIGAKGNAADRVAATSLGSASMDAPSRRQAIRILERGRTEVLMQIDRLPPRGMNRQAIGRGRWSPKDVVGHLATWEGFALEALEAWDVGKGWVRESELWTRGVNPTNRRELERTRKVSAPEVRRRADATHHQLIGRLTTMSDARWRAPATPRARRPLGERLGGILGGPAGPFRHAEAHLRDLRRFVEDETSG